MIDKDKREFGAWWLWIVMLLVFTTGIFTLFKPVGMWFERQVHLESHQYKETRATEQAHFKAELIAIDMMLQTEDDVDTRNILKRQKMMLIQQMSISKTREGQKGIISENL